MYKQKITVSRTIAGALVAGVVSFSVVVFSLIDTTQKTEDALFSYLTSGVALLGIVLGHFVSKHSLGKIQVVQPIEHRLSIFQTAMIVRLATLEGPALFSVVAVMLNNNTDFYVVTFVMVSLMLANFPTKSRLIADLKLSEKEINEVFD